MHLLTYTKAGLLSLALAACGGTAGETATSNDELVGERHLGFGTPTDGFDADDRVIVHEEFALSYNRFRNGPNWVSWILTKSDYGDAGRYEDHFFPDPKLPSDFYPVEHWDYGSSGYDRGHLVRSDERTMSVAANMATFQTTNILPQVHRLNVGPWFRLEKYCKNLVTEGEEDLYVIAGGVFAPECATNVAAEGNYPSGECVTIGKSKDPVRRIAVPKQFFKIIVHLPRGRRLSAIDAETQVTAVMMANDDPDIYDFNWVDAITTVDAVEAATGYDFLSKVAPEIQDVIEARSDIFPATPPP